MSILRKLFCKVFGHSRRMVCWKGRKGIGCIMCKKGCIYKEKLPDTDSVSDTES